MPSNTRC